MKTLLKKLKYDPDTGLFTWIESPKIGILKGSIAGTTYKNGYVYIQYKGKRYLAHRLAWYIMTGSNPKYEIDHKDRNRSNNKFTNLRDVTRQHNMRNTKASGVTYDKTRSKYKAQIMIDRKQIFLGRYETFDQARKARLDAEKIYFKENKND